LVYKAEAYRSCGVNRFFCRRYAVFSLVFLALGLAGCGRRGDPELPPGTPASQAVPTQVKNIDPMAGDPAQPGRVLTPAKSGAQAVGGNTFLLDPLVK
jgi:predicted small lipoprotein YifL